MERQSLSKPQRSAPRAQDSLASRRPAATGHTPAQHILDLQGTIGNQAARRLLLSSSIQAKLKVSQPEDKYEQEADRTAEAVMRAPANDGMASPLPSISRVASGSAQRAEDEEENPDHSPGHSPLKQHRQPGKKDEESRTPLLQLQESEGEGLQREESVENDEELMTERAGSSEGPSVPQGFTTLMQQSSGEGRPVPRETRGLFEARFGADFSGVRIHTGTNATTLNRAIQAKAFTRANHIYFSDGAYDPSSSAGQTLLAHELTHVIQQGQGGDSRGSVQREEAGSSVDDGEQVRKKMMRELERARGNSPEETEAPQQTEPTEAGSQPPKVNPAELEEKKAELKPEAQPPVDRAAEAKPQVEQAANEVKAEAEKPAEPLVEGADAGGPKEKGGKSPDDTAVAASLAEQASTMGGSEMTPGAAAPVMPPQITAPVDAGGQPLTPDTAADSQILLLAGSAQTLREQGMNLRAGAAQERANASVIRSNIKLAKGGIAKAEMGVATSEQHLSSRREVVGQAKSALEVSEQKADMVASEAPNFQSQGEEAKGKSGPMSKESKDLEAESESKKPDDDEAAGDAEEQSGKIKQVGSDINKIDDAVTQTKSRAEGLGQEAAQAKQTNTQTKAKIDATEATLDKTESRLGEMKAQSTDARSHLASLASGPSKIESGAEAIDQQGIAIIKASFEIESRLNQVQQSYQQGMLGVPAAPKHEGHVHEPTGVVQRQADTGAYHERKSVNLGGAVTGALPSWLTGEEEQKEADRLATKAKEDQRRRDQIAEINKLAKGNFQNLSAADKAGIALSMTGQNLFSSVGETNWPKFGANILRGLVDPRVSLMGVVSGLSMIATGVVNVASLDQWKRDPLGNLLKSAADIATGITVILGSITALALAIIVILTAAAILSFGLLGPVAAAIIPFCSTVVGVVGGWTITAAWIALALQGLVLIKNLVQAATADTADKLQQKSDEMTEDAKNAGNMALQIGVAKVMEVGGKALGQTKFGQAVSSEAKAIGEDFGISKPAGGGGAAAGEAVPGGGKTPEPGTGTQPVETTPTTKTVETPGTKPPPETPPTTKADIVETPPVKKPPAETPPATKSPAETTGPTTKTAETGETTSTTKPAESTPKTTPPETPLTTKTVETPPTTTKTPPETTPTTKSAETGTTETATTETATTESGKPATTKTKVQERPIPEGGQSLEERIAQGDNPPKKALENPDRYYYDPKAGKYKLRPEPTPDFSNEPGATVKTKSKVERPIPEGGQSIEERIAQGGNPPKRALNNPDRYYYDPEAGQYKVRPEPAPDFSGSNQRAIPCFPVGTLVVTADGKKPIETLVEGCKVRSFDEAGQVIIGREITAVLRNKAVCLVDITTGDEKLSATKRHRFWVENCQNWVEAGDLAPGMRLRTVRGQLPIITAVALRQTPEQETYNLTVADSHTYFIGHSGFLTHNQGGTGNGKIYIGRNPEGEIVYVGKTKQDLLEREYQHRQDAIKKPKKYGFKKDIKLEQVEGMDGLTDDQMAYHEWRIAKRLKAEGHKLQNLQEILTDPKVNKLVEKYC